MDFVEERLLFAIREAPDDDEPRLVYADWLAAREPLRAELIAVSCALARQPERRDLIERRDELLRRPELEWWKDVERGFWSGDAFRVTGRDLVTDPHEPLRFAPLARTLDIIDAHDHMRSLVELPALARYEGLRFHASKQSHVPRISDDEHRLLAASPHVARLSALGLEHGDLQDDGLRAVVTSGLALAHLSVGGNWRLTADGVAAMLRPSERMSRVTSLDVSSLTTLRSGLLPVLGDAWRATLRKVRANRCSLDALGEIGVAELASRPGIEELELAGNNLSERHLVPLVDTRATLTRLRISSNDVRDAGAAALVEARFERLWELDINHARLTWTGVARLFAQPPPALRSLNLAGNTVADALDVLSVAERPHLFEQLDVDNCSLDEASAIRFVGSPAVRALQRVDFAHNELGEDFVAALVASPHLGALRVLNMRNLMLDDGLVERLRARFGAVVLFDAP